MSKSKLFKLKEWITVPEAAPHLSTSIGEIVSEADILRLALDGHLKLSACFVSPHTARTGKIISSGDAKTKTVASLRGEGSVELLEGIEFGPNERLLLDERIVWIEGLWDLPMVGSERIDVERKYHELIGGPVVDLICLDGTFLVRGGIACQLQDRFKGKEINYENPISHPRNYYPSAFLPEDSMFVVRTGALLEFEQSLNEKNQVDTSEGKKENPKANASLLKIIITMAKDGYRYDHTAKKSELPKEISEAAALLGLTITDDSVRKWLKKGAELLSQSDD